MVTLSLLFLILAFVCFLLTAFGVSSPRVGLQPLGLMFYVLSILLAQLRW